MSATSRDRVIACPDKILPRVLIHVAGGLVQAVYASTLVDIHIYDQDIDAIELDAESMQTGIDAAQFDQQRRGLQQLY